MSDPQALQYDVAIVGGGIAGLQTALDLADSGLEVVIIEKSPSIGGKMISLSKVFPTLDCASCITTPRMASCSHHKRIKIFTYAEVVSIKKIGEDFTIDLLKKPRYLDEVDCISCGKCEAACPVFVKDEFERDLGVRKAISIPFTNAIPQYPVLDRAHCIACGACARVCPTKCIDFLQEPEQFEVRVKSVVLATGFEVTPMDAKATYGAGKYVNVISPLQIERLLAPHSPFARVIRPSDGKIPDSIAFVQCSGSRDSSIDIPYCSRICCMYSIKQAQLLSGSLPLADITIYYMDIRAFGKGYEQFYQNAKAMGICFVKAKVATIAEDENQNPILRIERQEEDSQPQDVKHDLVILSQGSLPAFTNVEKIVPGVRLGDYNFIHTPGLPFDPNSTDVAGIFTAGAAVAPKDIVDTVQEASSAAAGVLTYLRTQGRKHQPTPPSA